MKIVNKRKFINMVIFVVGIVITLFFYFSNTSFSKEEIKTKTIYVSSGDTLWSIAKQEKETNAYYEDKDVRDIIFEIKKSNNLEKTSSLKVGQKLIVNSLD